MSVDPDLDVTKLYGEPPDLELEENHVPSKIKRGIYKRQVTKDIARIDIAISGKSGNLQAFIQLVQNLHRSYSLFSQYHSLLHGTLEGQDVLVSEEYFQEIDEEYRDSVNSASGWIDTISSRDLQTAFSEDRVTRDEDGDSSGSAGGDVEEDNEITETTEEKSEADKLAERLDTHVRSTTSALQAISEQLEALSKGIEKSKASENAPVESSVITSTPTAAVERVRKSESESVKRRVSFGGISTVGVSHEEALSTAPGLDDSVLAAVLSMAESCKNMAETSLNTPRNETAFKLPKFKMFDFSGKAVDYLPFIRAFETQIEPRCKDASSLMGFLISHTSGTLQETMKSCILGNTPEKALEKAKKILHDRYGRFDDVAQAWLEKFHIMEPIKNTAELFELMNVLTNCQETLLSVDRLSAFETKMHLAIIINKLPPNIRERWQQRVVDISAAQKRNVRLNDVIEFCDRIYQEKADVAFGGALDGIPEDKKIGIGKQPQKNLQGHRRVYSTEETQPPVASQSTQMSLQYNRDGELQKYGQPMYNNQQGIRQQFIPRGSFPNSSPAGPRHTQPFEGVFYGPYSQYPRHAVNQVFYGKDKGFQSGCLYCKGPHTVGRCDQLTAKSPLERKEIVMKAGWCLNCLHPKHRVAECGSNNRCRACGDKHHTLIHLERRQEQPQHPEMLNSLNQPAGTQVPAPPHGHQSQLSGMQGQSDGQEHTYTTTLAKKIALPIVETTVRGKNGDFKVYALIDSGSTSTIITDGLLTRLGNDWKPYNTTVNTIQDENVAIQSKLTSIEIVSHWNGKRYRVPRCITRPSLNMTSSVRALPGDLGRWEHLRDLRIPDGRHADVELLIGQNCPLLMRQEKTLYGSHELDPIGVLSPLGWYVSGPVGLGDEYEEDIYKCQEVDRSLDTAVKKFWEIDDLGQCTGKTEMSETDKKVSKFWEDNVTHDGERYTLPIPFKNPENPNLPNNRRKAEHQFKALERRLLRGPEDEMHKYVACVTKYIERDYAEPVDESVPVPEGWEFYLNHHHVKHPRKPDEVRVVHNCSGKYLGISLNDVVHTGPDLMNKLLDVLVNFRLDRYAVAGDVSGMFNQILVWEPHRDVLRFLWWKDGIVGGPMVVYRMKTHLFGGVWSPSAANFILKRTAQDFGHEYDQAAVDMVRRLFYVDDGLKSTSPVEKGAKVLQQVKSLLKRGGFDFVKMVSNSEEILRQQNPSDLLRPLEKLLSDEAEPEFMLGNGWRPKADTLVYKAKLPAKPNTKRGILSSLCSLYDPLGIATPIIMKAKSLFQECCKRKIGWDEEIKGHLLQEWEDWRSAIDAMEEITVDRCVLVAHLSLSVGGLTFELHLFSDASITGYGTVCYFLVRQYGSILGAELMMSKGRLAPLKAMSVPRLELTAAHMSVQLERYLVSTLEVPISASHFHTDSTVVLWYITNPDLRLQTYPANRVSYITQHTTTEQWHHVPTKLNPADILSRGCLPAELEGSYLWKHGPVYLLQEQESWPTIELKTAVDESQLEVKAQDYLMCIRDLFENQPPKMVDPECPTERWLSRFASWHQMKKALVYVWKMVEARRAKNTGRVFTKKVVRLDEMKAVELCIVRYVQQTRIFNKGPNALKQYAKLFPVERDGILRVGGRLNKAPIHPDRKNPLVIPPCHVSRAIIWDLHVATGHAGMLRVLHECQQRYWLIRARRQIGRVGGGCFQCRRLKAPFVTPVMADLPESRVLGEEAPFNRTGIDYFGPMIVRTRKTDNKRYGCLMTCMATRAIHVEMAWSLDMDSCVNAVMRFAGRRGMPAKIRSDNGTNFVGADGQLTRSQAEWNKQALEDRFLRRGCEWTFNPPAASHMGGVWERQIRSVRVVLMNLAANQRLTEECLMTFMTMAEDIVNNRPLTLVSSDARDLSALTPNHFLRLNTRVMLPMGVFDEKDEYRKRWRQVQYLTNVFWDRWKDEYLPMLQERAKWCRETANLKERDVVVVKDDFAPRNHWPLGIIEAVYPDKRGVVRMVDVFSSRGIMRRPVHKLCLLEASK